MTSEVARRLNALLRSKPARDDAPRSAEDTARLILAAGRARRSEALTAEDRAALAAAAEPRPAAVETTVKDPVATAAFILASARKARGEK